jgi:hypothetical protein
MEKFIIGQQWLAIALIFFGVILYFSWRRWRDQKYIDACFGKDCLLALSFGVGYFGRASESGAPRRRSGFLVLLPEALFFRSHSGRVEVKVPVAAIVRVYHGRSHKGVELRQSLVKVDFSTERDRRDTLAFKVPYPPQWMRAIENACSSGKGGPSSNGES